ncbi:hypothetical protein [Mesorhizobium sp. SP-1A]|uniref:hypothetical protein n=1 Tax=Mesorhizobium sp. SP-1A TaxID=3077840 RepID=UPI0028F6C668|nr:hypothetical protein [Mesorhizobium sp. SP-1A]
MDDELQRAIRIEAAKAGKSMSKYIADRLREPVKQHLSSDEIARRRSDVEALREVFAGPKFRISENGKMPTADERNARR